MLKGRIYHFTESLWLLLSLAIFIILSIYTLDNALAARDYGDTTQYYHFPTWYTRMFIFIGCALMCLRLVIQLVQNLVQLVSGVERKELNQSRMGE